MTRDADTERPPAPDSNEALHAEMTELRAALANVGDLCGKLLERLTVTQLAMYTAEHRLNVLSDHDKDHETRLRRLEGLLTDPTPLATAAE